MTTNRDLKKLVRTRMQETGERYTTALAAIQGMKQVAAHASLPDSLRELDKAMGGTPIGKLTAMNPDGTAMIEVS